jgi:hypothetical protein
LSFYKKNEVTIIDDPVDLPFSDVVRKVFADFSVCQNYTDDIGLVLKKHPADEKAEAAKCKKKARFFLSF